VKAPLTFGSVLQEAGALVKFVGQRPGGGMADAEDLKQDGSEIFTEVNCGMYLSWLDWVPQRTFELYPKLYPAEIHACLIF